MLKAVMLAALLMFSGFSAMAAPADDAFLRDAARGSFYELEIARLAESRTTRPEVQTYASVLINAHEAYNGALRDLAASKGITIPSGLSRRDRGRFDRLAQTRGAAFDGAFLREALRINTEALGAFHKETRRTADPEIRGFITHFQDQHTQHLDSARALTDHVVASKAPVVQPPHTGDTMVVAPPSTAR